MIQVDLALQVQVELSNFATVDGLDAGSSKSRAAIAALSELQSESQWQTYFEEWINVLNPQQSKIQSYEVSLLLTTDADIQTLNATYRHQDQATDVLAFAALEWESPTAPEMADLPTHLGDIAISVETANHQAAENGHDLALELLWLASHGLLHLLGWDHPDAAHLHQMLSQQGRLMEHIGFNPPSWSAQALGY
jgi:probable rRNA maturation factor